MGPSGLPPVLVGSLRSAARPCSWGSAGCRLEQWVPGHVSLLTQQTGSRPPAGFQENK